MGGCEEALLGAAQPAVLCSIFDGHCGRGAAEEALTALPAALADRLPAASAGLADGSGVGPAWQDAFQEADRALRSEEGCTATAILAWLDAQGSVCLQVTLFFPPCCNERCCRGLFLKHCNPVYLLGCGLGLRRWCVQAANVGDSAAYFARVPVRRSCAPSILQLTGDHRYTNPKERERLAGASHPDLTMTRSLCCLPIFMPSMFSSSSVLLGNMLQPKKAAFLAFRPSLVEAAVKAVHWH